MQFNQIEQIEARSFGIALIMQTDNKNINHSEQYLTISYWDFGLSMLANPPGNYFLKFPGFKAESRAHAALVYWLSRSGADGTLHDCCTVPPHSFHWQYFVILTLAVTRNHEIFASQYTWNLQVHHHVLHLWTFMKLSEHQLTDRLWITEILFTNVKCENIFFLL